jgi:phosphoribosylglycinamide formyltransferase 2
MSKKILLLGSGELGKEFVIALKRLGQYVVAVDSYENAPAMQVADEREVIDMLDGDELDRLVEKHSPDFIIPEIEAIRTERLYDYEEQGFNVVPSAKATNFTMNRRSIRDLAAKDLGLRTARYTYANTYEELLEGIKEIGLPCVIKPLMSSSGKGQSTIKSEDEIQAAWDYSQQGRTGASEIIIEGFVNFHTEITVLTVTQNDGPTLFCPAIEHRQERGDYQESWQPSRVSEEDFKTACDMADKVTAELGGAGVWGVEFFVADEGVYFSELSPRPHDTGMTTMATQNLSEFELHARAILSLPIPEIKLEKVGCSSVILASDESPNEPSYEGIEDALKDKDIDIRIFGKPSTRKYRRMGVALCGLPLGTDVQEARDKANAAAAKVKVILN